MQTPVTFPSDGLDLAGTLFTPDATPETTTGEPRAALVVGHPGGGVKEQSPSLYAEGLRRSGFTVLVFDAAHQGESAGEPRGLEDPFRRAEDVKAAVTYLSTRADVDADRIGALGICASGGYVAFAAQTDLRIRAIATVSATDVGTAFRDGVDEQVDGQQDPGVRRDLLTASAQARTVEARSGDVPRMAWVPAELPVGASEPERAVFDYYRTPRGFHPRAVLPFPVRSLDRMLGFDAFAHADLLDPRPVLMIIGSEAFTARFSRETVARLEHARLVVLDGAGHYDLYDRPQHVGPALEELTGFFHEHLRR